MDEMNIIYEDNHLIVAEKPPNMPVMADSSLDADMLTELKAYIKEKYAKPGDVFLGLVHRLDRPVGGVMVFARTSKAAARLSDSFRRRATKKLYAALVTGDPPTDGRLTCWMTRDEKTNMSSVHHSEVEGAKPAALSFHTVARRNGLSLLAVTLETGRHHQIRAQLADAGFPIWGDQRYNPEARVGEQIALYAVSLTVEHPTLKTPLTFTIEPHGRPWDGFSDELFALAKGLMLKYIDENIVIIDKERGVTVAEGENALVDRVKAAYGEAYAVHRLDATTAGLTVFARNAAAKEALDAAFAEGRVKKRYLCTVKGVLKPPAATVTAYAVKDADEGRVTVYASPVKGARTMITEYETLKTLDGVSELSVLLHTGRTHQIRAHMAFLGHPLIGDDRYGDREFNRSRGYASHDLRAVKLEFEFPAQSPLSYLNGREFE